MEYLGPPEKEIIVGAKRAKYYFDLSLKPLSYTNRKGVTRVPESKSFDKVLGRGNTQMIDFVERCFKWNPEERMTPDEAFNHPWVSEFIDRLKEKTAGD